MTEFLRESTYKTEIFALADGCKAFGPRFLVLLLRTYGSTYIMQRCLVEETLLGPSYELALHLCTGVLFAG